MGVLTFEDAKNCPKCGSQGKVVRTDRTTDGGKLNVVHCQNDKCTWFNTGWTVQTKSDGTLYEREAGPKQFPSMDDRMKTVAQHIIDDAVNNIEVSTTAKD